MVKIEEKSQDFFIKGSKHKQKILHIVKDRHLASSSDTNCKITFCFLLGLYLPLLTLHYFFLYFKIFWKIKCTLLFICLPLMCKLAHKAIDLKMVFYTYLVRVFPQDVAVHLWSLFNTFPLTFSTVISIFLSTLSLYMIYYPFHYSF